MLAGGEGGLGERGGKVFSDSAGGGGDLTDAALLAPASACSTTRASRALDVIPPMKFFERGSVAAVRLEYIDDIRALSSVIRNSVSVLLTPESDSPHRD